MIYMEQGMLPHRVVQAQSDSFRRPLRHRTMSPMIVVNAADRYCSRSALRGGLSKASSAVGKNMKGIKQIADWSFIRKETSRPRTECPIYLDTTMPAAIPQRTLMPGRRHPLLYGVKTP